MPSKLTMSVISTALIFGYWGTKVDLSDFYSLVTGSPPEGAPYPDFICMMTQCGLQTFSCLTDRNCLKNLACLVPCGDDQDCTFNCIVNYENDVFHSLNKCNIHEAGCIKLKDPEVQGVCDLRGKPALSNLDLKKMHGTWYIVKGLNPTYDCFPCQIFTFSENKTDGKHMVYMDYQVNKMDGDIADKLVIEYISQPIKGEPGQLEFGGVQNGLWHSEQWRIVTFNKEFMIAEYCGTMKNWVYEGAIALVKDSQASQEVLNKIDVELGKNGFIVDKFCSPKYQSCTNIRTDY